MAWPFDTPNPSGAPQPQTGRGRLPLPPGGGAFLPDTAGTPNPITTTAQFDPSSWTPEDLANAFKYLNGMSPDARPTWENDYSQNPDNKLNGTARAPDARLAQAYRLFGLSDAGSSWANKLAGTGRPDVSGNWGDENTDWLAAAQQSLDRFKTGNATAQGEQDFYANYNPDTATDEQKATDAAYVKARQESATSGANKLKQNQQQAVFTPANTKGDTPFGQPQPPSFQDQAAFGWQQAQKALNNSPAGQLFSHPYSPFQNWQPPTTAQPK